jgi:hypothetical protein
MEKPRSGRRARHGPGDDPPAADQRPAPPHRPPGPPITPDPPPRAPAAPTNLLPFATPDVTPEPFAGPAMTPPGPPPAAPATSPIFPAPAAPVPAAPAPAAAPTPAPADLAPADDLGLIESDLSAALPTEPAQPAANTEAVGASGFPELDWAVPRRAAPPRRPAPTRPKSRTSSRQPARRGVVLASSVVVAAVLASVAVAIERWQTGDDPRAGVSLSSNPAGSPAPTTEPKATPSPEPSTTVAPAKRADPKFGVFRGTSRSDVRRFEDWAGIEVDYVLDYSARDTWSDISNPDYMLSEWRDSGYRPVYALPMLPMSQNATLAEGAAGEYDRYFRTLARRLVAADQEKAILRVGWEFNVNGSRWRPDDPATFTRYWRRIVKAMRSVDGQEFQFDWNVNAQVSEVDAIDYYPGNDVVDFIGVDTYDISWEPGSYPYPAKCDARCRLSSQMTAWDAILNGPRGLAFWSGFARSKGKPMSLPEWGMWQRSDGHGGGDNAYYIQQMHDFITDPENNVAYQAYFESRNDKGETHRLTDLDQGGAEFLRLFN